MKTDRILCYGDSNTWGYVPSLKNPDTRFSIDKRWTGVLQKRLGKEYLVIEAGLNSRTTNLDDPDDEGKNGLTTLPAILETHMPIDVCVLMLGTNDLKAKFDRKPQEIAAGVESLIKCIQRHSAATRILVLSPPIPILKFVYESYQYNNLESKARNLATLYEKVATNEKTEFLDLAATIQSSPNDGVHIDEKAHQQIAHQLEPIIKQLI